MIQELKFNSQSSQSDVERCISDVELCGGGVHWTSHTMDTGELVMEVWYPDGSSFFQAFSNTISNQYLQQG